MYQDFFTTFSIHPELGTDCLGLVVQCVGFTTGRVSYKGGCFYSTFEFLADRFSILHVFLPEKVLLCVIVAWPQSSHIPRVEPGDIPIG